MPSKLNFGEYTQLLQKIETLENFNKKNNIDVSDIISAPSSRVYRTSTDIQKLTSALDSSESVTNPTYYSLQQIYNQLVLDSEVTSVLQKRKNYVLAREYNLFKDGSEDKVAKDFFKKRWVKNFINYCLDALFYGYSLIQLESIIEDNLTGVSLIPRQNTHPQTRRILETPYQINSGISIDDAKIKDWYILISDSKDTHFQGDFSKIGYYQILLKLAQISQAEYMERFGSPNIIVRTGMYNDNYIKRVEGYLKNFNRTSYGIFSNMDEVQLVESSGKSSDIYTSIIAEMKSNINNIVLGAENLGAENSFVGSSEINEGIVNMNSYDDMDFVEYIINDELLPRLVRLGLTSLAGVEFKFNRANKMKATDEFAMYMQLLQNGFTVDEKIWEEKFNLRGVSQGTKPSLFPPEENNDNTDV